MRNWKFSLFSLLPILLFAMLSLCHMEMLSKKVCSSSALHKNSITRTIQQLAFSKPHQQPFHPFTTSTSQVSTMLTPQQVQDLEIVPNMFPSVDSIDQGDGLSMEILYNNEKVSYGSKMTPSQVKHEPTVHITVKDLNKYQPGHFFTLIMSDPDAPSRRDPKCREWLHWIKANMKINNDGSVSMKEVSNVADYMGSAPPKGTGYHRYVFSLFYHVGKLVHLKEHHWGPSNESRACFLASQFAKNHHMHDPVAIGCFEASHE